MWTSYGFHQDPFHAGHLPVEAGSGPLLVGRRTDHDRLLGFLRMQTTGKVMVQGPAGVGKTSLVNVVQWDLFERGERFPLLDAVELPVEPSRELFLLAVLSALVSSLRQVLGPEAVEAEPAWRRAREAVTRGVRAEFGLKLAAMGVDVGVASQPGQELPGLSAQDLVDLLRDAVAAIAHPARGFRGLLVPVSTLDHLTGAQVLAALNAIRDVTGMVDHVYWIFTGGAGLFTTLARGAGRISESFTANPIEIAPLAWEDVAEALERRRRAFALRPETPLPISERVARLVHTASGGELRFTLAHLARTVAEAHVRFPSELVLPDELALGLLQEWARDQLLHVPITGRESDVLDAIITRGGLRPKDHALAGVRTPQQMTHLLGSLVEKGYVVSRVEGAASWYLLSPAAVLSRGGLGR